MNTAIEYQYLSSHDHGKYETTVARVQKLFLDGWRVVLGLSGKDSIATSVCVIEGLKRARAMNADVGPLYVVTTDTTIENIVLHDYMLTLHDDISAYAIENDLPIECRVLKPALSSQPLVEYIGRGKLLRTPETSSKSRDCAYSWKIMPLKSFLTDLVKKHQTEKICSISGSRDDESLKRAANLAKRQENEFAPVMSELGWTMAPIKNWTLNDVWQLFSIIDVGDIESYSDHFDQLKKHYSAGNGGVCDLFAGKSINAAAKKCGARHGCFLCCQTKRDTSLENQINIDPKTYGFMKPLNELRTYMLNTLFDYNHRSTLGRKLSNEGYIKVGLNQYNLTYRMNLLRYVLSIQANAYELNGNHIIDLIDYRELLAIQYHWSREGGEPEPGMALKIWHEVVNEGVRYSIPETTYTVQILTLEYRYFPLVTFVESNQPVGLDDEGLDGKFKSLTRIFKKNGESHRVIRYTESPSFDVVTADAKAMMFVEDFYIELVEDGHLTAKCPTVMLKHLLESGVVTLAKGTIGRVHDDARRAQALNSLRATLDVSIPDAIMLLSVSERQMHLDIASRVAENTPQQTLF
ncbi:phosphoadenosine phosphosulfate reductase family protein [Shewanella oncorhynchi]|uniref:phosphoadenosine phosphosulfate reductase domain-containing protein n=1 Tax=Shewanella TaxID=22 RepID=UPI003D7BAE3B